MKKKKDNLFKVLEILLFIGYNMCVQCRCCCGPTTSCQTRIQILPTAGSQKCSGHVQSLHGKRIYCSDRYSMNPLVLIHNPIIIPKGFAQFLSCSNVVVKELYLTIYD